MDHDEMSLHLEGNFFIEEDALYLIAFFLLPILRGERASIDARLLTETSYKKFNEQDATGVLAQLNLVKLGIYDGDKCIIGKDKETASMLEKNLNKYIRKFMRDELVYKKGNYAAYQHHKDALFPEFHKEYGRHGKCFVISSSRQEIPFRFLESLLAFQKDGYIKILSVDVGSDKHGFHQYFVRLEVELKLTQLFPKKLVDPCCVTEEGVGYLKYNDEKIAISRPTSQPYRLLQVLTKPFGLAKSIEVVCKKLPKRKNELEDGDYLTTAQNITTLKNIKKSLQKIREFREVFEVKIDEEKKHIRLEMKQ